MDEEMRCPHRIDSEANAAFRFINKIIQMSPGAAGIAEHHSHNIAVNVSLEHVHRKIPILRPIFIDVDHVDVFAVLIK